MKRWFWMLGTVLLCSACGTAALSPHAMPVWQRNQTGATESWQREPISSPAQEETQTPEPSTPELQEPQEEEKEMTLTIDGVSVTVEWEENAAVEALRALTEQPLQIALSMYGGFEQVGPIGQSLPREDVQTTTQAGDIVLYAGDRIVLFYGSNSWAYTRLGRITDKSAEELRSLLGDHDVTITISR